MKEKLQLALSAELWKNHQIGMQYEMKGAKGLWKIAYYPIFECGKTAEQYDEPRALVEQPMNGGIDFREVPLRYLNHLESTDK